MYQIKLLNYLHELASGSSLLIFKIRTHGVQFLPESYEKKLNQITTISDVCEIQEIIFLF